MKLSVSIFQFTLLSKDWCLWPITVQFTCIRPGEVLIFTRVCLNDNMWLTDSCCRRYNLVLIRTSLFVLMKLSLSFVLYLSDGIEGHKEKFDWSQQESEQLEPRGSMYSKLDRHFVLQRIIWWWISSCSRIVWFLSLSVCCSIIDWMGIYPLLLFLSFHLCCESPFTVEEIMQHSSNFYSWMDKLADI